jgi:hypothetical protein
MDASLPQPERNPFTNVRLTLEEKAAFKRVAGACDTTRSRLLRKIIRELIGEGPDLLANDMRVMEEMLFQIAAVGRNLNQMVKLLYRGQQPIPEHIHPMLSDLQKEVQTVREELRLVVERSRNRWVARDA